MTRITSFWTLDIWILNLFRISIVGFRISVYGIVKKFLVIGLVLLLVYIGFVNPVTSRILFSNRSALSKGLALGKYLLTATLKLLWKLFRSYIKDLAWPCNWIRRENLCMPPGAWSRGLDPGGFDRRSGNCWCCICDRYVFWSRSCNVLLETNKN